MKRIEKLIKSRGFLFAFYYAVVMFLNLCRGFINGYVFVFIGSNVKLYSREKIKIGKFTRIEDFVELDGFGEGGIEIGSKCKIGKYSILKVPPLPYKQGASISIGDGTALSEFCYIGGASPVLIGKFNAIGQYFSIHPENHFHVDGMNNVENVCAVGIKIGDHNWFGAKSTILDGVTMPSGCTVGAGAIVVKGVYPMSCLLVGVPAKIKKNDNN